MPSTPKKYANPRQFKEISAILHGKASFASLHDAKTFLSAIERKFHISRKVRSLFEIPDDEVVIWIEHFELTVQELKAGLGGNHCHLAVEVSDDGKVFNIVPRKLKTDLFHPRPFRTYHDKEMPDEFHPIVRHARYEKRLKDIEIGIFLLVELQNEFPNTCKLAYERKLLCLLWNRKTKRGEGHIIRIIRDVDVGDWYFTIERNPGVEISRAKEDSLMLETYRSNLKDFSTSLERLL